MKSRGDIMIHEIGENRFDNQYRPDAEPKADDYLFVFDKGILIKLGEDDIELPCFGEFGLKSENVRYLFSIEDKSFFLLKEGVEATLPEGYAFESMRSVRKCTDMCMAAMTANHLNNWYRDNKCCGRCGAKTIHDDKLRALKCPECGNLIFPRLNPAVTVALRDGDRLLVSRYANRPMSAGVALIAGFVEIGETAEETVAREVMEEVGLKVKNIEYYGTQPWGFAGNLQMGYFCDVEGSTEIRLDEDELSYAEFVQRDELPEPISLVSLTATMIEDFKRGRR